MREYSGNAYHSSLAGGRSGGTLFFRPDRMVFQVDQVTFELPLDGLLIEHGGTGGRLLYFKHPAVPDLVLSTAEEAILQESLFQQQPGVPRAATKIKKIRRLNLVVVSAGAGFVLGLCGLFWLGRSLWIGFAVRQVPIAWEEKMGDLFFQQIKTQYTLIDDPAVIQSFDALTRPLVAVSNDRGYKIRLHVTDESDLNAFAVPGGHIVFHRGLLLKAESLDEVWGVLAHEMGHIQKRHSLRQITRSLGLYVAIQMVVGDLSGLLGVVQDGGLLLLQKGYSRDMEREADEAGQVYLARAGRPVDGMIRFFERLQEEEKKQSSLGLDLDFLSTHPDTAERIQRLRTRPPLAPLALQSEEMKQNQIDFSEFQNILRARAKIEKPKPEENKTPVTPQTHASDH